MKKIYTIISAALFISIGIQTKAQVNKIDSLALLDLYNNTNGSAWLHQDNWLSAMPVETWYGITVNGSRVTEMRLSYNNLAGPIPTSIGNITNLEFLYLSGNHLTGIIPQSIGDNCLQLQYLYLSENELSGPMPQNLENCIYLTVLDLSGNQLSGSIISTLGMLGGLEILNLSNNQFTGTIPISLSLCSRLFSLELSNNQLTGTIPESLSNTSLLYLALSNNQLTGTMPIALLSLPYCIFILNSNLLNGSLPIPADTVFNYTDLSANKYNTFNGFDPGVSKYKDLTYMSQLSDSLPLFFDGNTLSVNAGGILAHNTYRWFKNGLLDKSIDGDSTYPVLAAARYYVVIVNSVATDIKLVSYRIDISTLPVHFISFTAALINSDVSLNWKTGQEINVSRYNIQRSIDGIRYTTIATVNAKGAEENNYVYKDLQVTNLQAKTIYYRIEEKDNDGKTQLSNVDTIKIQNLKFKISPNPAKDYINIFWGDEGNATIKIYDDGGKMVKQLLVNGQQSTTINISNLAGGVYYAEINVDGIISKQKFIKQ